MTAEEIQPDIRHLEQEIGRLKAQLEEKTRLAEERQSQIQYLRADFDNYRKRSEKEKESTVALANENLMKDLLVILDDFERALPSLQQEKNQEGISMIYKKMVRILADYGLQPIECLNKKADPHFHDVICREKCGLEPGTILEDIERGYQLKTKVIRPSKVKVAEKETGDEGERNG